MYLLDILLCLRESGGYCGFTGVFWLGVERHTGVCQVGLYGGTVRPVSRSVSCLV